MLRGKIKAICGITLACVIASNLSPVVSYAITNHDYEEGNREKYIESLYTSEENASEVESKIINGVDTETDEKISVIVEFISPSIAEGISKGGQVKSFAENKVDRDHDMFNEFLINMPKKYKTSEDTSIDYSYREVFNGVSLSITGSEVETLLKCPVVKRIHPNNIIQVDFPEKLETNEEGATNLPNGKMVDSVPHIGVDDLHDENITGEGIKVGVLDTGIDYNHPDLTNAYKGFRADDGDVNSQDKDSTLGWDFVSNDADPMETTYEDWLASGEPEIGGNGSTYYTSHGTHVSGTIAGRAENTENNMAVKGVAPDVELYGYRVLGKYGSGATDGIIAAVEKSVKDGMDVINMSLGNSNSTPFDPLVTAVNNATLAGVVTVISNGNSGPTPMTVGSPGTAQLPIAVGASTTPLIIGEYEVELSDGVKLSSANHVVKDFDETLDNTYGVAYEAVYCGNGYETDFEGKDLTGKVALVDRGDITFVDKAKNAKNAGAEFTIIMNNTSTSSIPDQGEHKSGNAIAVNLEDGELLKSKLNEDGTTIIKLNKLSDIVFAGDEITDFSSAGPVFSTEEIRPDIVAPGYQTFSTIPEYINDKNTEVDDYSVAYGRMSGTSMAAPHIAGVAALILQENPDYTPVDVKAVMMNTSENINQFRDDEYSVHQQGAGRVNAYEAVHEETHISAKFKAIDGADEREIENETGLISFGKFTKEKENPDNETKTVPLTIENNSSVEKTYTISTKYSESNRAKDAVENGVNIDIDESVTVAPNSKVTLDATLNIPGTAESGTYEGYIVVVDSESNKDYQIPFSTSYKDGGFADLYYASGYGDFGKGLTAFTSSDLFNRDFTQHRVYADIEVTFRVDEEVSKIYSFVKDYETGEYIGYAGGDSDRNIIIPGYDTTISGLVSNGRVQKLKGNNITNELVLLEDGVYELELIGVRPDGTTFKGSLPIGIINDNTENEMTLNLEPGVTEVTEDMYTNETWIDNKEHEAIWLKGNISHPTVEKLKTEYGLNYMEQSEINNPFFYFYKSEYNPMVIPSWAKKDGEFLLAGIEKSDLENGAFVVYGKGINAGKVSSPTEAYVLVNEGERYLELNVDKKVTTIGEEFNAKLTLNNVTDISSGSFELITEGNPIYDIVDIKPTTELQKFLDSNELTIDINFEKLEGMFERDTRHLIDFNLLGDNIVGISDDMPLFDITYKNSGLRGIIVDSNVADMFADSEFKCKNATFENTKNEIEEVDVKSVKEFVNFVEEDKTRVIVSFNTPGANSEEVDLYIEDEEGNRYEAETDGTYGFIREFIFNDLPVTDGQYKVHVNMPGHFGTVININGGEYVDGKLVGTQVNVGTDSAIKGALDLTVGDANEDGAIDMHDVNMVVDAFNTEVVNTPGNSPDFTQDGIVDFNDFQYMMDNYGEQNFMRDDSKTPELMVDGRDIIDVFEDLGLFEVGEGFGIVLESSSNESLEGETVKLTANTELDTSYYTFKFYTRLKGEKHWELVSSENKNNTFDWTPEEAGEYEIKARALHPSGQEVQDTITHTVESLDSIVTLPVNEFKANNVTKKNVTVEWKAPENAKGLTGYVLYKDGKKVAELDANETSYTFKGLNRHTIYNFKVAVKYANGELSSKESITLRTKR